LHADSNEGEKERRKQILEEVKLYLYEDVNDAIEETRGIKI
jgi:hypothetical protein